MKRPRRISRDDASLLVGVPTLDRLANDPSEVERLPVDVAKALLLRCAALRESLRLRAATPEDGRISVPNAVPSERFLRSLDVANRIGLSESWVQKNPGELPPRRTVKGNPMWLESEIIGWMRNRPIYGGE